ncbi:hypothetical protein Tco_1577591 [Tanacetum coccineum]
MEAHCVNMELKYQNQSLKDGQHGQILNETSNKTKIKKEIEVLEKINIELEHSVAKLLAENEKLHKENEHLKQTYKDLYDSIKTTRVQTKDHNDSLIAQINSKTIENADLKAQIQEKVFANVALKNELRKLKGNSVDTKFAKSSILRKLVLQPTRNQSVVRQPNAFKSERPNFQNYGALNLSAGQWAVITSDQHPCFMIMASVDNTSGPVPQRNERCCVESIGYTISITWWKRHLVLSQYASFESTGGSRESEATLKMLGQIRSDDNLLKERRYKVVRHRYSNPMIQPEPEGSTQGYPLVSVEVLRYDKRRKSEKKGIMPTEMELTLEQTQQGVSYEVSVSIEGVEE